jgi:hypothetical protein
LKGTNGPNKLIYGTWKIKTNEDLDNLIEHKNIIHFISVQRLRWLGHVEGMPEERGDKEIYKCTLVASGPIGRPKIMWMDNVMKSIQAIKIVKWKRCSHATNKWK